MGVPETPPVSDSGSRFGETPDDGTQMQRKPRFLYRGFK